jgi:hypothetical protein
VFHTLDINAEREERLNIAHRLYQALIAQDPNRAITLCDGDGRVVARHHPKPISGEVILTVKRPHMFH